MLKRISIIAIAVLGLFISFKSLSSPVDQKPLTFAPLPMGNAKLNVAKSQMLIQLFQKTLNRSVIPKLYDSYASILKAFQAGEVDIIELGPLTYLALSKQTDRLFPLASVNHHADHKHYQCVVAAPVDGLQSLSSVKKARQTSVALTQPLSTCGWLLTERLLKQSDIKLTEMPYRYLGSHDKVALSLIRKEFQLGGMAKFVAEKYQKLGLNILAVSKPLPQFIIVGNPVTLSQTDLHKVQKAMLNYQPQLKWGLGAYGFSPVSLKLVDTLKDIQASGSDMGSQLEAQ